MKPREVRFETVPLYQPFLSITRNLRLIKLSNDFVINYDGGRIMEWSRGQMVILDLPVIGEKYIYNKEECWVVGYMPSDINRVIVEMGHDTIVVTIMRLTEVAKAVKYSDLSPGQKFKFKGDNVTCTKLTCYDDGKDMYSWGTRVASMRDPDVEVIIEEEEDQ